MPLKDRKQFVQEIVERAGLCCVEDVEADLTSYLDVLIRGSNGSLTEKRAHAIEEIRKTLRRNGINKRAK
jgi:hypothetical protein